MAKAKKKSPVKNKKTVAPKKKAPAARKASSGKGATKKAPAKKNLKKTPRKALKKKATGRKAAPAKRAAPKAAPQTPPAKPVSPRSEKTKIDLKGLMTPLEDRVLVQLTESSRRTEGGLFIPDTVADFSGNLEGRVVACGTGFRGSKGHLRPMDLKIGDRVIFSEYAGTRIRLFDQDLVILHETEVTGVLS